MRQNAFTWNKRNILICMICVAVVAAVGIGLYLGSGDETYADKYAGVDLESDVGDISRENTYAGYLQMYPNAAEPKGDVPISMDAVTELDGAEITTMNGVKVISTKESSKVTWEFDVPQAGFYNIMVVYHNVESRSINPERTLSINGSVPFQNANYIAFSRFWTDANKIEKDNQGNDIRPSQVEVLKKGTLLLKDTTTG